MNFTPIPPDQYEQTNVPDAALIIDAHLENRRDPVADVLRMTVWYYFGEQRHWLGMCRIFVETEDRLYTAILSLSFTMNTIENIDTVEADLAQLLEEISNGCMYYPAAAPFRFKTAYVQHGRFHLREVEIIESEIAIELLGEENDDE